MNSHAQQRDSHAQELDSHAQAQGSHAQGCDSLAQALDARLEAVGGQRFCQRGECDERTGLLEVEQVAEKVHDTLQNRPLVRKSVPEWWRGHVFLGWGDIVYPSGPEATGCSGAQVNRPATKRCASTPPFTYLSDLCFSMR